MPVANLQASNNLGAAGGCSFVPECLELLLAVAITRNKNPFIVEQKRGDMSLFWLVEEEHKSIIPSAAQLQYSTGLVYRWSVLFPTTFDGTNEQMPWVLAYQVPPCKYQKRTGRAYSTWYIVPCIIPCTRHRTRYLVPVGPYSAMRRSFILDLGRRANEWIRTETGRFDGISFLIVVTR